MRATAARDNLRVSAAAQNAPIWRHPEFARGAREMLGTAVGIGAWGLITGVAMGKSGIPLVVVLAMSLFVFAGSAQLAVLPLMSSNAPLWVVWATALCVNLRILGKAVTLELAQFQDPDFYDRLTRARREASSLFMAASIHVADHEHVRIVAVLDNLGTDDARVLCLDAHGEITDLRGLASTPGRDTWYAGQALVDGRMMGPPLGVRSITTTVGGAAILANVHVGGIPRSIDGGATWHPTIAVDADVHEVRAHPTRPEIVVAATAMGFAISRLA